ncbi:hypothetical protein PFICI_02179 [Pestalotiopsis fici W106-1]|uniref:N-acetyltransferase domain-containing protein n=1 Tax=Pestalotiopsis fici (strain W106-1 / CGMCC3.15140) TaxID=1229662 RepID=W3XDQ6_PESFW|nr:uncharacterized protein PFICI_02179 [Pestalotiopsis fici W106-1]ETS84154.1 hypothetical protein PFICI_02179 [Pestalotiopsis fici W106-1]
MEGGGPITIRRATREDIPAMVQILYRAFGTKNLFAMLWPESLKHLRLLPGHGDHLAWRTSRFESNFQDMKPWMHFIVAVQQSPTGEELMVGSAEWMAPAEKTNSTPDKDKTETDRETELPAGMDQAAFRESQAVNRAFEQSLEQALGEGSLEKMWYANSIAVDPTYQGKGIGTLLTKWGMDQAEKDGRDVYLLASEAGASLYRKLGFTEICEMQKFGMRQFALVKMQKA